MPWPSLIREGNDCISHFKDLAKIYQMPEGKMGKSRNNDNESPRETKRPKLGHALHNSTQKPIARHSNARTKS